jgi:hypothetical protein
VVTEFVQVLPYHLFYDLPCPCGCGLAWWIYNSKTTMQKQLGSHGLSRNLSTPENREFWAVAARARAIVASWPEWKRNVQIGATHD